MFVNDSVVSDVLQTIGLVATAATRRVVLAVKKLLLRGVVEHTSLDGVSRLSNLS